MLHAKPGTFCSRSCANSRTFTPESLLLKAESQRKALSLKSPDQRKTMRQKATETRISNMKNRVLSGPVEKLGRGASRVRILSEQSGKCLNCGISEWNGKPITFELDHMDGNNQNNIRTNLRMLCPNCHSQTPNWRGRKNASIA